MRLWLLFPLRVFVPWWSFFRVACVARGGGYSCPNDAVRLAKRPPTRHPFAQPSGAVLMRSFTKRSLASILLAICAIPLGASLAHADPLPGTKPLTDEGDIASKMVAGIDKFLLRE